jgi:hypothetical protein
VRPARHVRGCPLDGFGVLPSDGIAVSRPGLPV